MTDSEKWAVWTLGVVGLTIVAFFTLVAVLKNVPASQAAFALLALTALHPRSRRKITFDEREREIASKAQMAGFGAVWAAFIGVVVILGFVKGWDATLAVPMWKLSSSVMWATMLLWTVQCVTTLVLYRRGNHA